MYVSESYHLLVIFLVSVFETTCQLNAAVNKLQDEMDTLVSKKFSGARIPDYKVLVESFKTAFKEAKHKLDTHKREFSENAQKVGNIITTLSTEAFDTIDTFLRDFKAFARATMDYRSEEEYQEFQNSEVNCTYVSVRGDGSCLFRSFLTILANRETGKILPYDIKDIHMWIIRLKMLMCKYIQLKCDEDFKQKLCVETRSAKLCDYFAKFICHEYFGTDLDIQILAEMFKTPIHVIFKEQIGDLNSNTFLPKRSQIRAVKSEHFKILMSRLHYDAIINLTVKKGKRFTITSTQL
jgi:hypothetical protein